MTDKIKLTSKQKRVIRRMREGAYLTLCFPMLGVRGAYYLLHSENFSEEISRNVAENLAMTDEALAKYHETGAIEYHLIQQIPGTLTFGLTDLGKTIEL